MSSSNAKICGAKTTAGGKCTQPAGFGTWHNGINECHFHHKVSVHKSPKLCTGSCNPKSIFEECALLNISANPDVIKYTYEPFSIPYNFPAIQNHPAKHTYTPDILVTFKDRKPALVEVKTFLEMYDPMNLAKFKCADEYASSNNYEFEVWGFKGMKITILHVQDIFEECYFSEHSAWLALYQWIKDEMKICFTWADLALAASNALKNNIELTDKQNISMRKCWKQAVKKGFKI